MPTDVDETTLRGAMMIVSRNAKLPIETLGEWQMNKYFNDNYRGTFNKITKIQLQRVWNTLRSGPYPITGAQKVKEFSFEYWYNYFCREVPDAQVSPFFAAVVKDSGEFRTEEEVHYKRQLFAKMLDLGFKSFTPANALTAQGVFEHMLRNEDNTVQRDLRLNLLFRGDGRQPERIQSDAGTVPQTRIDKLRVERKMDQEWHPFSRQQWANKVWFRNGKNTDNCLFSAISVTPQLLTATKFPMLDDLVTSNPGAIGSAIAVCRRVGGGGPVAAVQQGVAARKQQFNAYASDNRNYADTRVSTVDRPEKLLLASRTQIYVIKTSSVLNTQQLQFGASEFPEYAMENIGWADHLACLWVIRIHYSKADANHGHLIVIEKWKWLHDEATLKLILTDAGYLRLKGYLEGLYSRGKLTPDGLGGIPYITGVPLADLPASPVIQMDGESWQIERIKDAYMSTRGVVSKLNQPQQAAPLGPPGQPKGGLKIPTFGQQPAPVGPPGQRRGGLVIPGAFNK